MAKDSSANRQQMRHRIAHMAARMIAEDGISDYGLAKRKAARQAGAPDSRNLPNNLEIEEALRAYQDLYQAQEHPERVTRLRELALDTMRLLQPFEPHLTGSVLSGAVARHGGIHLQLYPDSSKDVEIFLLNRDIPFRLREVRVWAGEAMENVPELVLTTAEAEIHLMLLTPVQRRKPLRLSADGRPLERASMQSVEALLAAPGDSPMPSG